MRPLGIESLRLFSEPSLFGRTNRLASWNGNPAMHILGRNECMRNQIELGTYGLYQRAKLLKQINSSRRFRSNVIEVIVPFKVIPYSKA